MASDPVFRRLVEIGHRSTQDRSIDHQRSSDAGVQAVFFQADGVDERCFAWIDHQEKRHQMRREVTRCAVGAWALLTFVTTLSSIVAFVFLSNVSELVSFHGNDRTFSINSPTTSAVPILLALVAAFFLIVGGLALLTRRFPGQRSTQASIDWATGCDAVAHLLSTGCTYSESLRGARRLIPNPIFGSKDGGWDSAATWLNAAADRVDAGRDLFETSGLRSSDEQKLRLLVQSENVSSGQQDARPDLRWRAAADHFMTVAQQRLGMLTNSLPPIATILSGILLWISISATLGWMWRSVAGMLRELGGGL
jgi:hypothetical protein